MKHWMPAVVFALLIFMVSAQSNPPGASVAPDYLAHFFEYGLFALTILWGVTQGLKKTVTFNRIFWCFLIAAAFSGTDEFHQSFVPHRDPSWSDIAADAVGAATFLLVVLAFSWLRRRRLATAR